MANNRNNAGTGFVNYGDILNANQGSGQRMGQIIADGLESQGQAVNKSLQQQQDEFNSKYGASQTDWSNKSQLAKQLAESGNSQDWSNVANVNNPNLTAAGTNFRNYKYSGPTGLSNASGLQAQAQSASNTGQLAGTSQGQQQLLGQYIGGNNYNQGQSQFDQALLNKYGRGDINQARKSLVGIGNKADNAVIGAQNNAAVQGKLIDSQRKQYSDDIIKSLGSETDKTGVLGQASNQLDKFNTDATDLSGIIDDFSGGNVEKLKSDIEKHPDLLNRMIEMGIDPGSLYNKDTSNYNQNKIKQIAALYTPELQSGGVKFEGDQQKAATNFANFLGDPRAKQIEETGPFNSKVFNADPDSLKGLQGNLQNQKKTDEAFKKSYDSFLPGYTPEVSQAFNQVDRLVNSGLANYTYGNYNGDPVAEEYFTDPFNVMKNQTVGSYLPTNGNLYGTALDAMHWYHPNNVDPILALSASLTSGKNPFSVNAGKIGEENTLQQLINKLAGRK